jgi:hypothetical protein
VRLFGLGKSIISRYTTTFMQYFHEDIAIRPPSIIARHRMGLDFDGEFLCIIWLDRVDYLVGNLTLGGLTFYTAILRQSQTTFQGLFNSVNFIFGNGLFMTQLLDFMALQPIMPQTKHPVAMPNPS